MAEDVENHPENSSDIAPLTLPENGFQSRIPSYLLEGKTEAEQYILNEVSKMGHYIEWSSKVLMSSNLEARRTNGKVKTLWALKNLFAGYKGLVIGIFAAIAAVTGVLEIAQFIIAHWPK